MVLEQFSLTTQLNMTQYSLSGRGHRARTARVWDTPTTPPMQPHKTKHPSVGRGRPHRLLQRMQFCCCCCCQTQLHTGRGRSSRDADAEHWCVVGITTEEFDDGARTPR